MVPTCSAASTACPACKYQLQATDVSRTTDISNIELDRVAPIAANKWLIPSLETFQISVTIDSFCLPLWPPRVPLAQHRWELRTRLLQHNHCVCQVDNKKDVVSENCLLRYDKFPSSSWSGKGPSYHFHVSLLWSLSIDALQRLGTTEQGSSKLSRLPGGQRFDPWY